MIDLDWLDAAQVRARVTFVQALNALAMAIVGGAVLVHEVYPDLIRGLIEKLPPGVGAIALFAFGVIVHLGLRAAKKTGL